MPEEFTLSDEELAELMAKTVDCTFEPGCPIPSDELQTVSHIFMQYLDRETAIRQEQYQQEVLPIRAPERR